MQVPNLNQRRRRAGNLLAVVGLAGVLALGPAESGFAAWRLAATRTVPALYNQGLAYDARFGQFVFSGTRVPRSALYRTSFTLRPLAARAAVLPLTAERYNHVGDVGFDPVRRRLILPLECYYPRGGGNTCRRGAFGVADPRTLRLLYHVNLEPSQIQKAMWAEVSPDGRWIWTSSGNRLLAYSSAEVNKGRADAQRAGAAGGLVGRDLGPVLPSPGVTGAAFYPAQPAASTRRLFLALNRGRYFQVVSYLVGSAPDGSPALIGSTPRIELRVSQSLANWEPEGLAVTPRRGASYPLGGTLHWLMQSHASPTGRILSYLPR